MLTDFRLKVFTTVSQLLSFTKAATELHISQPAVTKHIKELENEIGTALFVRQGSHIALTQTAVSLLPMAESILSQYAVLNESIDTINDQYRGSIKLGVSTTIIQYVLPEILAGFRKKYPDINITLISGNSEDIAGLITTRKADLAIVEGNNINQALHYRHLADDEIVLVTANGKKNRVSASDIKTIPLVIRENGSGTLAVIEKALNDTGILRKDLIISMQIGSSEGIIRYLQNSNDYAFISIAAVRDRIYSGQLRIVETDGLSILRSFRFASLHGEHNRITELFMDFCIANYNL